MTSINRTRAVGVGLLRYGLAFLLVMIGSFKFFAFEAEAIRPLIRSSPLLAWLYNLFDVRQAAALLGTSDSDRGGVDLRPTMVTAPVGICQPGRQQHVSRHIVVPRNHTRRPDADESIQSIPVEGRGAAGRGIVYGRRSAVRGKAILKEKAMLDDESKIRTLIERWARAAQAGDIEGVLVDHAADIVMFDVPPPGVKFGWPNTLTTKPLSFYQPAESGGRIDHRQWRIRVAIGIARHERIAIAGLGGGGADGILEVRPAQGQRPLDDIVVDRRDAEYADESLDALAGKPGPTSPFQDVEDRCHAMGRNQPLPVAPFNGRPQRRRDISIRLPIEDDVEEDVEVEQEPLHRYFRSTCWR